MVLDSNFGTPLYFPMTNDYIYIALIKDHICLLCKNYCDCTEPVSQAKIRITSCNIPVQQCYCHWV